MGDKIPAMPVLTKVDQVVDYFQSLSNPFGNHLNRLQKAWRSEHFLPLNYQLPGSASEGVEEAVNGLNAWTGKQSAFVWIRALLDVMWADVDLWKKIRNDPYCPHEVVDYVGDVFRLRFPSMSADIWDAMREDEVRNEIFGIVRSRPEALVDWAPQSLPDRELRGMIDTFKTALLLPDASVSGYLNQTATITHWYDLQPMRVESLVELPQEGHSLLVIALVKERLHVRVFCDKGKRLEFDETKGSFSAISHVPEIKQFLRNLPLLGGVLPERIDKTICNVMNALVPHLRERYLDRLAKGAKQILKAVGECNSGGGDAAAVRIHLANYPTTKHKTALKLEKLARRLKDEATGSMYGAAKSESAGKIPSGSQRTNAGKAKSLLRYRDLLELPDL